MRVLAWLGRLSVRVAYKTRPSGKGFSIKVFTCGPIPVPHDEASVALEIATLLQRSGITLPCGLRETGLYGVVQGMYRAGRSWETIGQAIGWSPINARECFVLEGGTLG